MWLCGCGVQYRNSMMTSVLRDSLGGNCKTIMVATISGDKVNTDESISTCRYTTANARHRNQIVMSLMAVRMCLSACQASTCCPHTCAEQVPGICCHA